MSAKLQKKRHRRKLSASTIISYLVLLIICALILLPILLTFLYSFFPMSEMNTYLKTRNNYDESLWMNILLSPAIVSLRDRKSVV